MIIKKFHGRTEEDAVAAAKKELGSNLVIMNVKEIKRSGIRALFKPANVEVTVALEDEPERAAKARKEEAAAAENAPKAEIEKKPENKPFMDIFAGDSKEKRKMDELEERLDSLQTYLEQQFQKQEEAAGEKKAEEKKVEEEIEKDEPFLKFTKLLRQTLQDNEVDEVYIRQIMSEIEKVHTPGMPFDYALSNTYQKMVLKFGKPEEITPAKKGPKMVFFIGPTGVGKTTTIAKIASKFCVEEKKKVALLTADTYRIAAVEQLRVYANILNVPFRVIYTVEEVENALRDYGDYDYIFVDTAGHSHKNEEQKNSTCSIIHCVDGQVEKEVYLVVSVTTKYRDLRHIADSYREMGDYKLIFTKLDETSGIGSILNLKLYTGLPLSYVTCGQNVPDDIEIFDPQRTVKQLLGGKR